jgi:aminoglycoside phosphotransferase (APT) family kinase protein
MALGDGRDLEAVRSGVTAWLRERRARTGARVRDLHHPGAGFSSETIMVDLTWDDDGTPRADHVVLRLSPTEGATFEAHDLTAEVQAQRAAAAAGVPVATPTLESDPRWLGAPFVCMPRVDGHIPGGVAHADPWLRSLDHDGRAAVYIGFLDALCDIHAADLHADDAAGTGGEHAGLDRVPRRDNATELDRWERYLDWSSEGAPLPVLVDALRWCREHRPATEPDPVLLWGDVRLGNVVFGDDLSPRAVLDWDMTGIGAPEHDLAWFTSLDSTAEALFDRRLRGFPERDATVAHVERRLGRPVADLAWYETLAALRSTSVMTRIGLLQQQAGQALMMPVEDNPILDLLRDRLV